MSQQPDGRAFAVLVSSTVGKELNFPDEVGKLYEACSKSGQLSVFSDLAFLAKSFQKLSRLLEAGISDDDVKSRISGEAEDALKKFLDSLGKVRGCLPEDTGRDLLGKFLGANENAFSNALGLLEDFGIVKDFFLSRRDMEQGR